MPWKTKQISGRPYSIWHMPSQTFPMLIFGVLYVQMWSSQSTHYTSDWALLSQNCKTVFSTGVCRTILELKQPPSRMASWRDWSAGNRTMRLCFSITIWCPAKILLEQESFCCCLISCCIWIAAPASSQHWISKHWHKPWFETILQVLRTTMYNDAWKGKADHWKRLTVKLMWVGSCMKLPISTTILIYFATFISRAQDFLERSYAVSFRISTWDKGRRQNFRSILRTGSPSVSTGFFKESYLEMVYQVCDGVSVGGSILSSKTQICLHRGMLKAVHGQPDLWAMKSAKSHIGVRVKEEWWTWALTIHLVGAKRTSKWPIWLSFRIQSFNIFLYKSWKANSIQAWRGVLSQTKLRLRFPLENYTRSGNHICVQSILGEFLEGQKVYQNC